MESDLNGLTVPENPKSRTSRHGARRVISTRFQRCVIEYLTRCHRRLDHDILEFFEDVGSLYNRNLLNKELARSSFSWEAVRWWEAAKVYIADERRAHRDESLYREVEAFAKTMQKYESRLSETDLKDFLAEEKTLETD